MKSNSAETLRLLSNSYLFMSMIIILLSTYPKYHLWIINEHSNISRRQIFEPHLLNILEEILFLKARHKKTHGSLRFCQPAI